MSVAANPANPILSDEELKVIWRRKLVNMKRAWSEFEEGRLDSTVLPFKVIIELTQNCNFRCPMCPQSYEDAFKKYHPEYNMPMDIFVRIADQLFPTATMIDLRGFGETTILPHWPEVVKYLEKFPFIVWHLITNLSLPRDDTWERMIDLGFILGFSCDGATAATFESIRKGSRFEKIRHNLGLIQKAIRRTGRGWIYFVSTIQEANIHELEKIVEFAREFGVQEVQFKIVQGDFKVPLLALDREKVKGFVEESLDAAAEAGIRVTFNDWFFTRDVAPERVRNAETPIVRSTPHPLPPKPSFDPTYWDEEGMEDIYQKMIRSVRVLENQKCFKPFSFAYVNYKGELGTCNHMMYPDMLVMGDLNRQSLAEIWNGPKYREFRRDLLEAKPKDTRCQWCFAHRMDD